MEPLRCASLLGLRNELAELAERWDLPLDDAGLQALLRVARDPDDGWVADPTEILTFARLALAANEAMRRDCPLWLVGRASDGLTPIDHLTSLQAGQVFEADVDDRILFPVAMIEVPPLVLVDREALVPPWLAQ